MPLGWISSLWEGRMNLVASLLRGGATRVGVEEAESFSSMAVMHVVRVPRAFVTSLKVGSDASSVDRRSGSGWVLFLILVDSPFLGGFMHVFNLGAIVNESKTNP